MRIVVEAAAGKSVTLSDKVLKKARIEANKQKFYDSKESGPSGGKLAPPNHDEKSNGNRRLIGGKLMKWDPSTKQWNAVEGANIVVGSAPAPAPAATVAAGTSPPPAPSTATRPAARPAAASGGSSGSNPEREAQIEARIQ